MTEPKSEVFNMDNIEFMRGCKDGQFDLAIVDPPYGININNNMGRRKGDKKSKYKKINWDFSIPPKEYFEQLFRISKNQIVWGGNYFTNYLYPSPCWVLWDKKFSDDISFSQFELGWTSFNSTPIKFDKHPSQLDRIHPTQKPVALYTWLLQKYAKEGNTILDTHLGSGSSRIACWNMKFDFTGIELDKEYFDASVKRFNTHKSQLKMF